MTIVKGHPTSQGWTALQTQRMPGLTKMMCARYVDCALVLSVWKYDSKAREAGNVDVDWEMTLEVVLEHHAIATFNTVYLDGMRDQLTALLPDPRKGKAP